MKLFYIHLGGNRFLVKADDIELDGYGVLTFYKHLGGVSQDGGVEAERVAQFKQWDAWMEEDKEFPS